jgi:phosphoacetylglucosamine mutase
MLEAEAGRRYPKPDRHLAYGTAGFRARADVLDSTFFRMGMLAALRSRARGGLWVGLMVTASHNPEADNGIKLVDCDGGMLAQAWERHATAVANAPDDGLAAALASVADQEGLGPNQATGRVLIGRDTRSHSARLSSLASEGAGLVGSLTEDAGLVTTPQLHHVVRFRNYLPEEEEAGILPQGTAGTEETGFPAVGDPDMRGFEHLRGLPHQGYFRMLAAAFDELCEGKTCEPL